MEMAFILFIISVIASILLSIFLLLVLGPISLVLMVAYSVGSSALFYLFIALAILFLIVSICLFGAFLTTFQVSSWVLLFDRISVGDAKSKLERIVEGLILSVQKTKARKKRIRKLKK